MTTGIGFGKVILFGEHFVGYGNGSIASGIPNHTTAELVPGTEPGFKIVDKRDATCGYKEKYAEAMPKSVENMNDAIWHLDFKRTPVKVILAGDLYCASGVGASAANCVAMARAVSEHFGLDLTDEQINQCGLEGDRAYAGTPSGIDNTCATYGQPIFFRKNLDGGENQTDRFKLGAPLHMLLISTGITTKTIDAMEIFNKYREANPDRSDILFREAEELALQGKGALEAGDLELIGQLMNRNHEILREFGVSHPFLESLVDYAREHGAIGAKLTGGGRGGYMVALFPDARAQETAAGACKYDQFKFMKATIG